MRFRFLFPLLALVFMASSSKPRLALRFHAVADPRLGDSFTMPALVGNPPREITVEKVPIVSEQDVSKIFPFPAADGSMGCAFKLDENGKIKLNSASNEKRGAVVAVFVNGRVVTAMRIDRQISDGIVSINSGLTPQDIKMFQEKFHTLGEKTTFKRRLSDAYRNQ